MEKASLRGCGTQVWIRFSVKCNYLSSEAGQELYNNFDHIIGKLVNMMNKPEPWLLLRSNK